MPKKLKRPKVNNKEPDDEVETVDHVDNDEEKHGLRSRKPYIIAVHGGHGDNYEKINRDNEVCRRISDGELEVFHVDYGDDNQYRWRNRRSPLGFNSRFFHIRNPDFDDTKIPRMKGLKGKDYLDLNDKGKWQLDLIKHAIEYLKKYKVKTTQENIAMVASQSSNMSHLYTVAKCEKLLEYYVEKGDI